MTFIIVVETFFVSKQPVQHSNTVRTTALSGRAGRTPNKNSLPGGGLVYVYGEKEEGEEWGDWGEAGIYINCDWRILAASVGWVNK